MTQEAVAQWCNDNGFALIDIKRKEIDTDTVKQIAKEAVDINCDIHPLSRNTELVFARYLAVSYLINHFAVEVVRRKMGFKNHSTVIHAREVMNTELKYFQSWQQKAIIHFNEKITEMENALNKKL